MPSWCAHKFPDGRYSAENSDTERLKKCSRRSAEVAELEFGAHLNKIWFAILTRPQGMLARLVLSATDTRLTDESGTVLAG